MSMRASLRPSGNWAATLVHPAAASWLAAPATGASGWVITAWFTKSPTRSVWCASTAFVTEGGLPVNARRETGRTPVQRNTFYEPIKVWEDQTPTGAGEAHAQKSAVLEKNLATA